MKPDGYPSFRSSVLVEMHIITISSLNLSGLIQRPDQPRGLIVFARRCGFSRANPEDTAAADALNALGFATLQLDLLTPDEQSATAISFDADLLKQRLLAALHWVGQTSSLQGLPLGLFSAGTAAAAVLSALEELSARVDVLVLRGGRPNVAALAHTGLHTPTLFLVDGNDGVVMELYLSLMSAMTCKRALQIIESGAHDERGRQAAVVRHVSNWFDDMLPCRLLPASATTVRYGTA